MTPELTTPAVIAEIIDELTEPKAKVTYTGNLAVYNQDERHKRLLLDNKDRIISYIRSLEADHRAMKEALKKWTDNSECYDERDYCGECFHCKAVDSLRSLTLP